MSSIERPRDGNSPQGRGTNPSQPSHIPPRGNPGRGDDDEIIQKVKACRNLSDLPIEEITREEGLAERFAKRHKDQLKATQLRKFFDKIITNQEILKTKGWESIRADFHMIRPGLAYAKGRKLIPDEFFDLISACLERIAPEGAKEDQVRANYDRFVDILQSIVAYHKYHGGK
ncbi:MAG: type III-A CRISPR-associated protein Csm2 [Methanolinea sp.]|nr:type III-A CRISPR-associated protein Csm2 [Methanolinea sp.]